MARKNEKGVALILVLILLAILSIMAVSLLFVGQAETWSSMNYRMMTQARYGAEAGVNAAADYLQHTYAKPTTTAQLANFNTTVSPVTYSGNPVTLSANSAQTAYYPDSTVKSDFASKVTGTIAAGNTTVTYKPSAQLLSMQAFKSYPSTTTDVVQKWLITGDGTINGVRNADVQISAIMEQQKTATFAYAAFATFNGCNALGFGGGGTTDSYDSSTLTVTNGVATPPTSSQFATYGGNVGTNGNLAETQGKATLNGTLSTPRSGTGTCTAGNVTALTQNNVATVGNIIELPQPITYPDPPTATTVTTSMSIAKKADCTGLPAGCTTSGGKNPSETYITVGSTTGGIAAATQLGNLTVQGNLHLVPPAGTLAGDPVYININSIQKANGGGTITVDPIPGTGINGIPAQYAQVVVSVVGNGVSAGQDVIDLTGNSVSNPTLNPADLQILYGGQGNVKMNGSAGVAALLYAPNASASFNGGGNWYGAVIVNQLTDLGGAAIHYDRRLQTEFYSASNYMLTSFNWQKY
jgi:Tfp pilus assembly protein PilX